MPQISHVTPHLPPLQVPIHIKLAQEFALMDKYYTSFPGPSTPNHLYLMSGTNAGCITTGEDFQCTKGRKYPQKTIFQSLAESNHTWRCTRAGASHAGGYSQIRSAR